MLLASAIENPAEFVATPFRRDPPASALLQSMRIRKIAFELSSSAPANPSLLMQSKQPKDSERGKDDQQHECE